MLLAGALEAATYNCHLIDITMAMEATRRRVTELLQSITQLESKAAELRGSPQDLDRVKADLTAKLSLADVDNPDIADLFDAGFKNRLEARIRDVDALSRDLAPILHEQALLDLAPITYAVRAFLAAHAGAEPASVPATAPDVAEHGPGPRPGPGPAPASSAPVRDAGAGGGGNSSGDGPSGDNLLGLTPALLAVARQQLAHALGTTTGSPEGVVLDAIVHAIQAGKLVVVPTAGPLWDALMNTLFLAEEEAEGRGEPAAPAPGEAAAEEEGGGSGEPAAGAPNPLPGPVRSAVGAGGGAHDRRRRHDKRSGDDEEAPVVATKKTKRPLVPVSLASIPATRWPKPGGARIQLTKTPRDPSPPPASLARAPIPIKQTFVDKGWGTPQQVRAILKIGPTDSERSNLPAETLKTLIDLVGPAVNNDALKTGTCFSIFAVEENGDTVSEYACSGAQPRRPLVKAKKVLGDERQLIQRPFKDHFSPWVFSIYCSADNGGVLIFIPLCFWARTTDFTLCTLGAGFDYVGSACLVADDWSCAAKNLVLTDKILKMLPKNKYESFHGEEASGEEASEAETETS